MATPTRRVVTGKDENGKAVVMIDGMASVHERKETGVAMSMVWVTDAMPAEVSFEADAAARKVGVPPPSNGTIFRVVEFAPDKDVAADAETRLNMLRQMGLSAEGSQKDHPRHPGMHKTNTIDYAAVLSGEIDMLLDDSEVHLKAGDVVVQQATNHAWANRGDVPCQIAFILVDAKG